MVLYLASIIALATPFLQAGNSVRISGFEFIFNDLRVLDFGELHQMAVSNIVIKAVLSVYAAVILIGIIASVFGLVDKKGTNRLFYLSDYLMAGTVFFQLLILLIGQNYQNIFYALDSHFSYTRSIRTGGTAIFIISLIILLVKLFVNWAFLKKPEPDQLQNTKLSIATSFVLMAFVIAILFTPLYAFVRISFGGIENEAGIADRLFGYNILFGTGNDVLSFLPSQSGHRFVIAFFLSLSIVAFIINLILYLSSKRIFIQFNKISNYISFTTLSIFALLGANYLIVWADGGGAAFYQFIHWNTWSYIPLAGFVAFALGVGIVKLCQSKQNIEYKVYAKAEGKKRASLPGGGQADDNKGLETTDYDPIPAFSQADNKCEIFDTQYGQRLLNPFYDLTLPNLVNHVIEYARHSKNNLSYGHREIKTFIAGLAASRLSILQGMSGTGKTSLPKIFMESIDGICQMIAVESSWRDKNELLGFYNEFNKKFTAKPFTCALYEASLNVDVPVFIVLDEMNLSRIEYYFSDFLSLMEADENKREIKLFDVQLDPQIDDREEYLSLVDGNTLPIPKNIWFVGTANRDESTFEISDKVYDRAQTINFDKRAAKVFNIGQKEYPKKFVSFGQLRQLFDEAVAALAFDAEENATIKKVEILLNPYKISFGNRILKQIEEFVKVYVTCSGGGDTQKHIHEAIDCIIFSKVVRKLEFKQINNLEELTVAFSVLKLPLCEQFLKSLI